MYRTLGTIDRLLERIPFGSGLLSSLQAANLTFLDRVHLHDMRVHDRISGMEVDIAFLFQGEIAFPIPGFPALVVVLGAKDSAYTFLRGSIMIGEASVLILHDLSITMRLDTPLLRPAPIDASVPIVDHVEIQLYGEAVINSDFDIETTLAGFNLPPFSIGGTGLIVAAEDCMLDLSAEATPAAVTALGYGPEFKGVLGQRAHLYWLPQAVFDGVPGLRLDFEHIVIGHDGVSFHLVQTWQLHDNGKHILTSSELAGYLFDASWELGLHQIAATVQQNRPIQFVCTGKLRVPFLDALFDAGLGLRTNDDGYEVALSLAQAGDSALIDLGAGSLVARNLLINGEITDTGFTLEGSLGGAIDLAPLALNLNGATIRLEHEPDHDVLAVMLSELSLGPLGEVEKAVLRITSTVANGGTRQNTVLLETTIAWQDLRHRLKLDDLPEQFPLPPDDAQVTAYISWEDNGAGGHRLVLRFTAALSDLGSSWTFIREEYRPQLRNVRFTLEANYADAVAFQSASTSDTFSGHVFVELELRPPALPDVPGAELFEVDREQWIKASLTTGVRTINGSDEGYMEMALADAPAVKINFPGLPQAEPPIQIEVKKVEFDLKSQGADSLAGQLSLEGEFLFRPINPAASMLPVPPAMAVQMEKLFKAVGQSDFGGTAKIDLRFKGDKAALELSVVFDQAKVELDLFDMMVGLTRGMALPQELNGSANRVDLDIDFDIQLREIRVHCGSIEDAGNQSQFGFELVLDSTFAGVQVEGFSFKLTGQEFSAGFSRLAVPITLPHFPVSQADLNMLRDDSGAWDYRKLWLRGERPQLAGSIALLKNEIEALKLQLGAATGGDEAPLSAGLRAKRKALFEKSARQFLIDSIFAVHQAVGQSNRGAYQAMVDAYMALMDATLHQFSFDTTLDFVLRHVRFVLPFQNPTDIRVEGGAQLVGFKPEDPLAPLGDLVFKLGLSAEYLYFNVEGGDPIPIPVFGQYQNDAGEDEAKVSIRLNHARIGYGYSKNALVVALAGELKIAKSLADDLNAAGTAGIGIRLPEHGRLGFKLDLIPITLGEVDFLLPLLDFTIDLRKEYSPGISDGARCEPYWDGLQLIAPNIIRYGFKRLSFAPFFGSLLAPNYNLSFDVTLGNGENGLTYVCNDYLVILSTSLYTIIPLLTDGTPFFNNLCTSIRLAGFGVSFNLQRPFPSMSPLALFEIFGLLADPNMPIDPDGALANMIRVRIQNARITLPPAVVRMFPEVGTVLSREIDYTANLGTLIALLQPIAGSMGRVAQHFQQATGDVAGILEKVTSNPPQVSPAKVLALLPPELRRIDLHGSFVGFDASATFVLLTPGEAAAAFARRDKQVNGGTLRLVLDAPFDNLPDWMFNNDDLSGWEVLETGNNGAKWRIQEGDLRQIARIDFATYVVYKKDFQDLAFTAELSTDTKSSIGLIFGFQDGRNYYRFALNLEQGQCELVKVRDGRATMLEQIQYAIETRRRYRVTVRSERAGARSHLLSPKAGERVRIMIDGQELIEHVDQSNPFTKGRVGLYCQGNPGARFGGVQVYQYGPARRPQYGEYPDPAWLMAYHPTFSKAADPVHDPDDPAHDLLKSAPFDDFDATSLAALPVPSAAASGVLVGADVKVLEDQVFRVLGYLFADGTFSLTSTTGIEPLRLSVAGIQVELALAVKGRLMLTGRAQGAQSYSQVTAKVWGSWEPLPNIIELNVGRKTKPLDLTVDSNGRFSVRGGSQLKLFGGAANLDGEVDVSHTHCFVHGTFTYTSKAEHKIGKQHIVELSLAAAGRIGPGNQIELSGAGNLKILGKIVRNVQGRISDKGIMVDAQFKTSNWNWNGILIKKFSAALQGVIDFNKTGPPNLVFAGDCYLRLFGASNSVSRLEISGRGGIRTDDVHLTTFVEGKMFWQGRQWLQGRLLLHSQTGVHLEGQAHFGFLLSPREVGGIRVASLIFRINLGGTVRISPNGSVSCNLRLEWDLGVNLPGAEKQILPVASNVTHVTGALDRPIVLANLDGFRLLPLQGLALSLPIPEITGIGDPVMKIGTKNGMPAIFMQEIGTLYFDDQPFMNGLTMGTLASLTGGTLPSLSPGNFPTLEFNMGIPYLDGGDLPTLDPGSFPAFHAGSLPEAVSSTLPVPSFSQGEHFDAGSTRTPIHEAYTLDWAQETIPINLETFAHAPISFGIDQENYKFYLQIAGRKYALTGRPILQ